MLVGITFFTDACVRTCLFAHALWQALLKSNRPDIFGLNHYGTSFVSYDDGCLFERVRLLQDCLV